MTITQAARRRVFSDISRSIQLCRASSFSALLEVDSSHINRRIRRMQCRSSKHDDRSYSTSTISSILLPPTVFIGLLGTLWFYKCCMMVLFQNKIIYMPSIPPFSRREEIKTYEAACHPVKWQERRIKSEDNTQLALCVGEIPASASINLSLKQVILVYFQG